MNESGNKIDQNRQRSPYPSEFLGVLGDAASQTLVDWLMANQAPIEVVDLLFDMGFLRQMEGKLGHPQSPTLIQGEQVVLADVIANAAWGIVLLGGVFEGSGMQTVKREPLKWNTPGS